VVGGGNRDVARVADDIDGAVSRFHQQLDAGCVFDHC
jgi:hypothetical protein